MNPFVTRSGPRSACGLTFLALACARPPAENLTVPRDTVVLIDTVRVDVDRSSARVGELELRLMEREAQMEALERRAEEAMREVVRSMARLQTLATRAEAASAMAEADVALRELRTRGDPGELAEVQQAQRYLDLSTTEFTQDNFGGALYLANQAKAVAAEGRGRLVDAGGGSLRPGEVRFAVPVSLETTTRSNVREGPGLDFAVAFTMDAAMPVTGQSYADEWVRIVDREGRAGWIHYSLVRTVR